MRSIISIVAMAFLLVGCASLKDKNVSLENATIVAKPATGGQYEVVIKGYSSTKVK